MCWPTMLCWVPMRKGSNGNVPWHCSGKSSRLPLWSPLIRPFLPVRKQKNGRLQCALVANGFLEAVLQGSWSIATSNSRGRKMVDYIMQFYLDTVLQLSEILDHWDLEAIDAMTHIWGIYCKFSEIKRWYPHRSHMQLLSVLVRNLGNGNVPWYFWTKPFRWRCRPMWWSSMLQSVHAKRVDNGNTSCVKFNALCCLESPPLEYSHSPGWHHF